MLPQQYLSQDSSDKLPEEATTQKVWSKAVSGTDRCAIQLHVAADWSRACGWCTPATASEQARTRPRDRLNFTVMFSDVRLTADHGLRSGP